MNAKMNRVGEIRLGNLTVATEPCHDKDVWCRIDDIPTLPGTYYCYLKVSDEGKWGKRVAAIRVVHQSIRRKAIDECLCRKYIGKIGVDAGFAGFYNNKPNYTDEQWSEFVDHCHDKCYIRPEGFCSESGYGDGSYNVYGHTSDGQVYDALEIIFINDDFFIFFINEEEDEDE